MVLAVTGRVEKSARMTKVITHAVGFLFAHEISHYLLVEVFLFYNNMKKFILKFIFWSVLVFVAIILLAFLMDKSSDTEVKPINTPVTNTQQPAKAEIYTTDEGNLMSSIIDESSGISMVDVQYALARLIDDDPRIFEYPFYAMKNQKGEGYVGIIVTDRGEALFLVPYKALNQTKKSDLIRSIKAINGTAKSFNYDLDFATGYDPLEVMGWIHTQ